MFTGIIEELGEVAECDDHRLLFRADTVLTDAHRGDSIAVNGCCLTVVDFDQRNGWWCADVTRETLDRTNLGELEPGSKVNLERPVTPDGRLGGHLVQGHVDAVGEIVSPAPELSVRIGSAMMRYVVEKGSISVDGISLTVVDAEDDAFTVAVIPHTQEVTTLGQKGVGERVNIEVDITAKHIEKLIAHRLRGPELDRWTQSP